MAYSLSVNGRTHTVDVPVPERQEELRALGATRAGAARGVLVVPVRGRAGLRGGRQSHAPST